MQLRNSELRYGTVAQSLHWLTALCVLGAWLIGTFVDFPSPRQPPDFWLLAHIALGQGVLVLLVVRLAWRWSNPLPPPEKTPLGRLLEIAARISHWTLYLLLVVPALGIVAELKRAGILPVFAFWQIQSPWPVDRDVGRNVLDLHGTLADALLVLAGIHAVAAIVHHWVWRDRTLARMLPGRG